MILYSSQLYAAFQQVFFPLIAFGHLLTLLFSFQGTVKALEKEISLLKQELAMHDSLVNRSLVTYDPLTDVQVAEIKSQIHKYLQGDIDEIDIMNFRQVQEVFRQFKLIVR